MLIQYDISESVGIRLDCKTEIEPLDVFVSASRSVGFALLMDNCAIVIELSRTVHSDNWYWPCHGLWLNASKYIIYIT